MEKSIEFPKNLIAKLPKGENALAGINSLIMLKELVN